MPDTQVNLNVSERGAAAATKNIDGLTQRFERLAPNISAAGSGLAGLGQVARLIGPEFDKLGQSISNIGVAASGLGALGSIFGPIGQAIGTLAGVGVGLLNTFVTDQAQEPQQTNININNNVNMNAEVAGRSVEDSLRDVVDQFAVPFQEINRDTSRALDRILRERLNSAIAGV